MAVILDTNFSFIHNEDKYIAYTKLNVQIMQPN